MYLQFEDSLYHKNIPKYAAHILKNQQFFFGIKDSIGSVTLDMKDFICIYQNFEFAAVNFTGAYM